MGRLFKAVLVFAIWWIFKDSINSWEASTLRFFVNLLGIGLPVCLLLEPVFSALSNYFKMRCVENSARRVLNEQIGSLLNNQRYSYRNPFQDAEAVPKPLKETFKESTLLNSAQIEQLNELRSKVAIADARQFPQIRVSGATMTNLVPGAGIFTAKIKRHGELQNLVVMLATLNAVYEFEKLYYSFGSRTQDFWAEGHLLPSRTGLCYSVLFVTAFRFNGRRLSF